MGIVYEARDLQLQRLVALKMIRPGRDLSHDALERLLAEARAVAQFKHPHLVQIYDIGEHDGQPYFSLELLEGGSLKHKLAGTPQPAAEAAALLETLARTVDYAHQKSIVHRDLKPANVLLAADGTAKVADFGLAKQMDQDADPKEDGGMMGTPSYMAPEQAWGKNREVGPPADIYALGAILYEVLTGRPPFRAADRWQTIQLVRTQEPVSPRQLVPQVPRDLELICLKCLTKDPLQRFPSARELADELRRFQEGRPIRTRPAPVWEQAWKWGRRQPAVASLIAVSLAALLSFVLYLDQRARAIQRDADKRARVVQQEAEERERIGGMRDQVKQLHLQAREAADRGNLPGARGFLQEAFGTLRNEPSLADLKPRLDALEAELAREETEQQEKKAADDGYRKFWQLRDTALLHGMVFTGVDLPVNVAATKQACREALALYGVTVTPAQGPVFPKYLSAEQQRLGTAASYELLLVWAEAEAQPEPGLQKPRPAQLEEALRLLDRAAHLDLPANVAGRAYHLRRAEYLHLQGKADAAREARQRAADTQPAGALDYFLTGASHQKEGRFAEAASDFVNALRAQPDHFWARYFLGVCSLQRQRPAEARAHFSACLTAQKDLPWLYLLLAFANGQLDDFPAAEKDYDQALYLLTLKPDEQAHYGILLNRGVLRLRQAQLVEGWFPLPWPQTLVPQVEFAVRGVAAV